MFLRILKKDLTRKKTMNFILFLFIAISTAFLAASVNNLTILTNAVDYYLEQSNTPDYLVMALVEGDVDPLHDYLKTDSNSESYEIQEGFDVSSLDITILRKDTQEVDSYVSGQPICLTANQGDSIKIFDEDGAIPLLSSGEIAIPYVDAASNNLMIGDQLTLVIEGISKQFTLTHITKDSVFGSSMVGLKRYLICPSDYDEILAQTSIPIKEHIYSIYTQDLARFEKAFKNENFSLVFYMTDSMLRLSFIMEMLISGILIIVSVCLILISFFMLRFTIIFTLQEDYQQIGIMKALGIKDRRLSSIYLTKYTALALIGATFGFFLSFPFGRLLLSGSSPNMLLKDTHKTPLANALCALVVVLLVIAFCYSSTNKLKKFTVMEAIRKGSTGERYHRKNFIALKNCKSLPAAIYMAFNDITSNLKRFSILIITFCLGILLIIIPLNAANTLKSENIVELFGMSIPDFFVDPGNLTSYMGIGEKETLVNALHDMEDAFAKDGYPADLFAELVFPVSYFTDDPDILTSIATLQSYNNHFRDYALLDGTMAVLPNEIMLTELSAKEMNVGIGDSIHATIDGTLYDFIITGTFQSMNMAGKNARFADSFSISYHNLAGINNLEGVFREEVNTQEAILTLQEKHPDYIFETPAQYATSTLGEIITQVDSLKNLIALVIIGINILITALMMKTLMTREHGEIALLKSLGFSRSTLRIWQTVRISIILFFAIILGIILSILLGPVTVGQVFTYMGANHIKLVVIPIEVYIKYPLLVLAATTTAAFICSRGVDQVDFKEINNLE